MAESPQVKLERHERRYQALQMRIAGVSHAVIAQRLGYSSPAVVVPKTSSAWNERPATSRGATARVPVPRVR